MLWYKHARLEAYRFLRKVGGYCDGVLGSEEQLWGAREA